MLSTKALVDIFQSVIIIGLIVFGVTQTRNLNKIKTTKYQASQNVSINTASSNDSPKFSEPNFSYLQEANLSLQASISGLLDRLETLETTPKKTTTVTTYTPVTQSSTFRPQSIYLGPTSTNNTSWEETDVEVKINSDDYPSSVRVTFEAGLSIIGGEAWARLKNKGSGSIIQSSKVMHNNSTTTWNTSSVFNLLFGTNTYVVEMKSSSGETANLAGARIRIFK